MKKIDWQSKMSQHEINNVMVIINKMELEVMPTVNEFMDMLDRIVSKISEVAA